MDLLGRRIFITGGSGGIGAATVKEAATQGAQVAFSYNKGKQKADSLLKELDALSCKTKAFAVQMDLTDQGLHCKSLQRGFRRFWWSD